MFFVHHDEAELGDRGKYRRTGAHGNPSFSSPQQAPGIGPLTIRERAMQDGHLLAERATEPSDRLRGKTDLRHQHDRALSFRQYPPHRLEIDVTCRDHPINRQ